MGGWQYPFFVFAIPGTLLGILALFMRDYQTVRHVDDQGNARAFASSVSRLLKIPTLRWLYVGFGIRSLAHYGLLSWLPAFFMRAQGIAEDKAGMAVGVIYFMPIIGAAIGGVLADRLHKRNPAARMLLLAVSELLAAVCAIAALLLNVQGAGYLLMCAWGALAMLGMPALSAVTQDVAESQIKTMSFGLAVFSSYLLGGAWGPVAVGAISDGLGGGADGLRSALIIVGLAGFVAAYLEWRGSRTYPADADKVRDATLQAEQ
jgi:predicted MFS family arabinose efflux permease